MPSVKDKGNVKSHLGVNRSLRKVLNPSSENLKLNISVTKLTQVCCGFFAPVPTVPRWFDTGINIPLGCLDVEQWPCGNA